MLAGVLMVGFCLLEAAEMLFAPERAAGLAEVFGGGGWWAAPAALFVSALVTAITCGGRRLLIVLACRSTRRPSRPANAPRRTHQMQIAVASPLATRAAGRAPPYRRRAALAERTQAA